MTFSGLAICIIYQLSSLPYTHCSYQFTEFPITNFRCHHFFTQKEEHKKWGRVSCYIIIIYLARNFIKTRNIIYYDVKIVLYLRKTQQRPEVECTHLVRAYFNSSPSSFRSSLSISFLFHIYFFEFHVKLFQN